MLECLDLRPPIGHECTWLTTVDNDCAEGVYMIWHAFEQPDIMPIVQSIGNDHYQPEDCPPAGIAFD